MWVLSHDVGVVLAAIGTVAYTLILIFVLLMLLYGLGLFYLR